MNLNRQVKLAAVIGDKNNNFNLMRMLAALAVIFSHSYALSSGERGLEPFKNMFGISLGTMAVDIFFITSGLLVTRSLCYRSNLKFFVVARVLRIFPALFVSVLFCVFLGLLLTSHDFVSYLQHNELYRFVFYNSTIVITDYQYLPGVFHDAPYDRSVNGSLWTLPWELRMYLVLITIGLSAWLLKKVQVSLNFIPTVIILIALCAFVGYLYFHFTNNLHWFYYKSSRFLTMFFFGGSLYILQKHITISAKGLLTATLLIIIAFLHSKTALFITYLLALPYLVLCAAYLPQGRVVSYNKLGDFSYGTYIYAWPVQQTIAISITGITPFSMSLLTIFFTTLLAILSWHFIEKPSMALRRYFS